MIQWFPGHMAKAMREMQEKIKLCDLIIILLDARIPHSSLNPSLKQMINNKRVLYVFTKMDKADEGLTRKWMAKYNTSLTTAIAIDARASKSKKIIERYAASIMEEKRKKDAAKGLRPRPVRTMIIGIPNVGKSTLINTLSGKKVATVGDKPGVTKAQQWIRMGDTLELLDTPGVLWPKFEDQNIGFNLAITGAIKDNILPVEDVAGHLIEYLDKYYHDSIINRYGVEYQEYALDTLIEIGKKQNFYLGNKEVDTERAALFLLQEFRNVNLGKITLDRI